LILTFYSKLKVELYLWIYLECILDINGN
jgi:hypothetical protein